MTFDFTVSSTAQDLTKRMMQLGLATYPLWVTIALYVMIILSVVILSAVFGFVTWFVLDLFISQINTTPIYLVSVLLAVIISLNHISPLISSLFTRFMRFESDLDITCHYHINSSGVTLDEGDRYTQIGWSAIAGVFATKDLIVFHCRGLNYFIPKSVIGNEDEQMKVLETCSAWQKAAKGNEIAKTFV